MPSIPASQLVSSTPSVLNAGGTALDMISVFLTNSTRVPIGTVPSFPSATAVGNFFGQSSPEAVLAGVYFLGFDNSNQKPGALLFSQYPSAAVAGYLQGGNVSGLSLAALQALTGTLSITVGGVVKTSTAIVLTAATSFSSAATIILAAFTTPGFTLTFDSVSGGFIFTDSVTGALSTMSFATGTLAAGLLLTQATGAVLSQGAAAATPAAAMTAITAVTQNWVGFMTVFEPVLADKVAFGEWTNAQDDRYIYAMWDTNVAPASTGDTTSAGALLIAADASGTVPIYQDVNVAAFLLGSIASIDFTQLNGRTTLAFRSQTGLAVDVVDGTIAKNLKANGYNFYGQYSTANENFNLFYPGSVTGPFDWVDSYVNQIWLTNQFQLAGMEALTQLKSIPYNTAGYALLRAFLQDPITAAGNFGIFRSGVTLSAAQAAEVNSAAGLKIDAILTSQGSYLQILDASPQVRQARGTPGIQFFYMDGESVQSLNISTILLQ